MVMATQQLGVWNFRTPRFFALAAQRPLITVLLMLIGKSFPGLFPFTNQPKRKVKTGNIPGATDYAQSKPTTR